MSAQSLIYSYAQQAYLRAGHIDIRASALALTEAINQTEEDAAVTYVALQHAEQAAAALAEESALSAGLERITEERQNAGLESAEDVRQVHRSALQLKLQVLLMDNEHSRLSLHMAELLGIEQSHFATVQGSAPPLPAKIAEEALELDAYPESPALMSANATAAARLERVRGDSRYIYRPQLSFAAQYGRVSPINDVSSYYNLQGNYNTVAFGVQVQLPLFDLAHKARVRQQEADAQHAVHEAQRFRSQEREDHLALGNTLQQLAIKAALAEIDRDSAVDQLKSTLIQTTSGGYNGPPKTPKEEQSARIRERQTYVDLLEAQFQLRRSQIFLLRQTGDLERWIERAGMTPLAK